MSDTNAGICREAIYDGKLEMSVSIRAYLAAFGSGLIARPARENVQNGCCRPKRR